MHYNVKQLYTPPLEIYELNERALIIDTETVGAGPTVEVIEIAACDITGRVVYESLVRPHFNRLPAPSRHHRFERKDFDDAPYWTDIWPEISSILDGRLLVAYNAAFDRRAIAAMCSRYQQTTGERGWRCAMQLFKKMTGTKRSLTLDEACAHFGLLGGTHRAADDVRATYQLLAAMKSKKSKDEE